MIALDSNNFQDFISSEVTTVIVDIWMPGCEPCKKLVPVLDELEREHKVTIGKLNASENLELAASLGVRTVPTMLIYKNGNLCNKLYGYKTKEEILNHL